ncbi:MAG TPA: preprotein translocase subunit SecG [Haliangiales bacterium]|nr:preprotein translocase subunit SecG [Haliangiales bacterium]
MLNFFIGLLTVILVLDCLLLMLLILIQLPKKEAGAGIAFGGGATDALFGAGSGTALTKITKYSAGVFLGLSLLLSAIRAHQSVEGGRKFDEELKKKTASAPLVTPSLTPTNAAIGTNAIVLPLPASSNVLTNLEAPAPATNPPAVPAK